MNLILSIAGVFLVLLTALRMFLKRKDDENDSEMDDFENAEDKQKRYKNRYIMAAITVVLAIAAVVLFVLTEDMRLLMVLVDWYTIYHAIIFAAGLVAFILAVKREKQHPDDEEQSIITRGQISFAEQTH